MLSVQLIEYGEPGDNLRVVEVPDPRVGDNDVLVEVKARPINPSDVHFIQGDYGYKPMLPSPCGFEGMGIVLRAPANSPIKPGQRVGFAQLGSWQQKVVISSSAILPVPDTMSDATASQLFVNPCTAWAMVHELNLKPGQWLALTAGGSTIGQMMVRFAAKLGIKTICIVRRKEQAEGLLQQGATEVVVTFGEGFAQRALDITEGRGVDAVVDAVGGPCGGEAIQSLATGGTMLIYGLLSGDSTPVNNGQMIFRNLTIRGFWMTEWAKHQTASTNNQMISDVIELMSDIRYVPKIEASYPLEQVQEAVCHSMRSGRLGKVLLV